VYFSSFNQPNLKLNVEDAEAHPFHLEVPLQLRSPEVLARYQMCTAQEVASSPHILVVLFGRGLMRDKVVLVLARLFGKPITKLR